MKLFLYLFLLELFIIKIVGSNELVESSPAAGDLSTIVKYHGGLRHWTIVDPDGRTYISLNALKEAVVKPVKLLFPKEKIAAQILSDLTLFSPTNAEDECKTDTTKLEFKLKFDNENWIRGEVIVELKKLMVYLSAKCPGIDGTRYYVVSSIDAKEANFENEGGRLCFQSENPFQSYGATNKNMMELQVSATFKCKLFLILPTYMDVEDEVLPPDVREPLNSTFAAQGEEFWLKSRNDESLSDGIAFVGRDVVINITESTKSLPYFLRIGKNQPYPSLQLNFDPTCSNLQFDLFVNLRDNVDCRIAVKQSEDGFQVTTKGGTSTSIRNGTKSPSFIFARGQSKVYVKAGLSIIPMDVCQIENMPDVPSDQFVLQIVLSDISCNGAQIIIPAGDVKNKIEVLVDRVKAAALIPMFNERDNLTSTSVAAPLNSTYATVGETTDVATGALQWWWIVVPILIVGIIVAAVILICYCIRRRRKQTSSKSKSPQPKTTNDQNGENVHPAPKIETAISVEQPPPPKMEKSKMDKKMPKKEPKEQEIGESKKSEKRSVKEKKNHYEQLPTNPPTQGPPPTISATQEDPTLETAPTQNSSNPANSIVQTRSKKQITSEYINFGK